MGKISKDISKYHNKYLLTINAPDLNGYTHEYIISCLRSYKLVDRMTYYCMCDESVKSTGQLHTHMFIMFEQLVPDSLLIMCLPFAHIEPVKCSFAIAKNYILKRRNYKRFREYEETRKGFFEEWKSWK